MQIYFSPANLTFYPDEFKKDYEKSQSWPSDANPVEYEIFQEYALKGKPIGKKLGCVGGQPVWVADTPSEIQNIRLERLWRDVELKRADLELYKVQDSDPKANSSVSEWRNYRKSLRAWPEHKDFPNKEFRPKAPDAE